MAACFPKLIFKHSGCVDLCVASKEVLLSHELLKSIEDSCAVLKEENAARGSRIKHEEFLLFSNDSVVSFLELFFYSDVVLKHFF